MTTLTTLRAVYLAQIAALSPMQRHTAAEVARQMQERDGLATLLAIVTGAIDPDAVDCETPPVDDWQDERNSRPFPF
jgi:hypothetical protein